ncbi:MAG: DUF3471 domain-containing protein, partial [Bacteroidota bacterium]
NSFGLLGLLGCLFLSSSLFAQAQVDTTTLEKYTGYYFFSPHSENVHVTREGQQMYLQPDSDERFNMQPLGDNSFILPQGITITFVLDEQGKVKHAIARKDERETILPPVEID